METKVYKFENKRIEKMNYLLDTTCKEKDENPGLIVFLHGAGERGYDFEKLYVHGPAKYIRNGSFTPKTVVLCPQCPEKYIWNLLTEELFELIESVVEEYSVDRTRIAITGISMGGYGTWEMGMSYPGYFSALGPVCGGGVSWRANLIGETPVWAFHGDADNVVPPVNSIEMCERLAESGGKVDLTLLHKVGHNSWEFAYERSTLLSWLAEKSLPKK